MLAQNNKNIESKFFEFENLKSINDCVVKMHKGWNKSIVIKFCMKKENSINNLLIKKNFPSLINKEKIIVVTSGVIDIKKNNKKLIMKKFDALNFSSDEKNYEIKCSQESDFYLISCEILPEKNFDTVHFNFKKDIYGQNLEIIPLHLIRSEKKFSGISLLKKQIDNDIMNARNYLNKRGLLE